MEEKLDKLFISTREKIFELMREKKVDVDILAFDLGISRKTFIENFSKRIDDFAFYIETLDILENWRCSK